MRPQGEENVAERGDVTLVAASEVFGRIRMSLVA